MKARTARLLLVSGAFLAGLVICFSAIVLLVGSRDGGPAVASAIGGPFALTDQNGRRVTDRDMLGRPYLVFFGFTHCPDICPTTLFDVSEVMRSLGPDADKTAALFISVDPERDTPAVLKDYLASFDPRVRGLTADPDTLAAVFKEFRVYYKKVPLAGGDYTMDHSALVYLMDKSGRFVAPFSLKRPPDAAAADLRRYF